MEAWQQAARSALGKSAAAGPGDNTAAESELVPTCRALIEAISDDLDTPQALHILDEWAASGAPDAAQVVRAVDALLGIQLLSD